MGKQIVCPICNSAFDENILKLKNSEHVCLVCGSSLATNTIDFEHYFPEDIKLGEFDSFDDNKIDMWWYDFVEPGKSYGLTCTVCTKCGECTWFPYPIAIKGDYVIVENSEDKCYGCGREVKNFIFKKCPPEVMEIIKRASTPATTSPNVPKCPICSSTNIHKISLTNKAVFAVAFGFLSAGHISKTFKCDNCGAKF